MIKKLHTPIFVSEILRIIEPVSGMKILDMTFGSGGHSKALLKKCPDLEIFALDRDPIAYEEACILSKSWPQIKPLHGKFSQVKELITEKHFNKKVDAVLMDLGTSAMQLDDPQRGFSFKKDARLDMRMDNSRSNKGVSAYEVVNEMSGVQLAHILKACGEEGNNATEITRLIDKHRNELGPIVTTTQLADVIKQAYLNNGKMQRKDALSREQHAATRAFQALRIFVNDELSELDAALANAHHLLEPSGICVAITFHSLEEHIVKQHFNAKRTMSRRRNFDIAYIQDEYDCNDQDEYDVKELESALGHATDRVPKKVILERPCAIKTHKHGHSFVNNANDFIEYSSVTDKINDFEGSSNSIPNFKIKNDSNHGDVYNINKSDDKNATNTCQVDSNDSQDNSINGRQTNDKKGNNLPNANNFRFWTPLIKKAIRPSSKEIENNPRSKSAKLRAAFKC